MKTIKLVLKAIEKWFDSWYECYVQVVVTGSDKRVRRE